VLKPGEYDNCFVDTGTVKPFEPLKKAARDNSLQGKKYLLFIPHGLTCFSG